MNTPARTAIVTGASRGIGRAIAVALGAMGSRVVINYNSNHEAAREAADEIERAGGSAMIIKADIGSPADRTRLVDETLARFEYVDLLVNNAGIAPKVRADLLDAGEESFDQLISTNLKGPYFLTQRVAKEMIRLKDKFPPGVQPAIVNVSSISAYTASVNRGDYCLSKAGIGMMTQLFAARLAEYGIGVFEIRPGVIATDMTGPVKAKYDKLILQDEPGILPIRRWGQPDDIAKAVVAIASGLLPYSTGEVINVDGGFHMRRL